MYSCRRPDQQQNYITAQCFRVAVTSNTNVFLPPSSLAADLNHSAVHFNCSNKQHKSIPAAVQTSSRYTTLRIAFQLQ